MPRFAKVAAWMDRGIKRRSAKTAGHREIHLSDIERALEKQAPGEGLSKPSLSNYSQGKAVPGEKATELLANYFFSDDEATRKEFEKVMSEERKRRRAEDPWRSLVLGNALISVGIVDSGPLAFVPQIDGPTGPARRTDGFFDFLLERTSTYAALPVERLATDIVTAVQDTGRGFHLVFPLLECPDRTKTLQFFPTPLRIAVAAVTADSPANGGFAERMREALLALTNDTPIDLSDGDLVVADVEIGGLFVLQAMRAFETSHANIITVNQGDIEEYVKYLKRPRPTVAVLDEYSAARLLKEPALRPNARLLLEPWNHVFRPGQRRLPSYPLGFATARAHREWSDHFARAFERSLEAEMDTVIWAYSRLWAELVFDLSSVIPNDGPALEPQWSYSPAFLETRTKIQLKRAELWADRVVGFSRDLPHASRYIGSALWREVLSIAATQRQRALDELSAMLVA